MVKNKALVNLGLNIFQSLQIDKINESQNKINQSLKQIEEGHIKSQVIIAAGFAGLAKQNERIDGSLNVLHNKISGINNKVVENNILTKKIDGKVDELNERTKRSEAMLESQIMQKKISDQTKQIVFGMGQEVKNIKKNSNALERFIMYLIISESIKMNSNIKIEIIDTIPGKEAFQEIMDSIENGINDSFEMIPEKDLEEIIKLHKAKESLSLLLPEYNNIQDELDIKIKEKKEIEDNFLKDNEEIEEKVLKANEELINETSWTRKKLGETWYAQYSSNKKPKNKFFRWAVQSLFWTFVVPFLVVFIQEMGFFGNELAESLFKFTVIAGIALSGGFVAGGIAFWIHQKIFLKKVKNLESSKEKASIQLNDRIEKGADLSQIKSAMTLLVEKLNSIIPENITNEIEAMVKKIYDKHKDLKNYIDLDLLPSIIFAHTKNEVK